MLEIYLDWYNKVLPNKKRKAEEEIEYDNSLRFEESDVLSSMLPLEGDEEVKQRRGLKILSPNRLLTRLPILLAQTKAGNPNKLKTKSDKYYIFYISII